MIQDIEDERENRAEKKAGRQREIDGSMFASPSDVSGQAPERPAQLLRKQDAHAQNDNEDAREDQQSSQSLHPP